MNDTSLSWLDDPDTILFVTNEESLAVGAVEQQSLGDSLGRVFGRSREEVKGDLAKTFDQMRSFLDGLSPSAHGYEASEITFELAFSAQGRVAFIAEAGMTSAISVTFKRKGGDETHST